VVNCQWFVLLWSLCYSERIVKIDQHLTKLWPTEGWHWHWTPWSKLLICVLTHCENYIPILYIGCVVNKHMLLERSSLIFSFTFFYLLIYYLQNMISSSCFGNIFWNLITATCLRFVLLIYGLWQDEVMAVGFTDIDYTVFTDAARYLTKVWFVGSISTYI